MGEHNGAHYYTIGQRKGLAVGGTPEPLFVIEKDTKENVIYTGQGENHPGLQRKGLFVPKSDVHWVRPDLALSEGDSQTYDCRIRYRQPLEKATLFMEARWPLYHFRSVPEGNSFRAVCSLVQWR